MASSRAARTPPQTGSDPVESRRESSSLPTLVLLYAFFAVWVVQSLATSVERKDNPRRAAAVQRIENSTSSGAAQPANAVWLVFNELSRCRRSLPANTRWHIAGAIHDQSRHYGYDPLFVVAMVIVESTCSPSARGPMGARGLIQVKPETARAVSRQAGVVWSGAAMLTRPSVNLRLGLHYLSTLESHLNDPYLALAAYNMGPGNVSGMARWQATRTSYVRKVFAKYEELLERRGARPQRVVD